MKAKSKFFLQSIGSFFLLAFVISVALDSKTKPHKNGHEVPLDQSGPRKILWSDSALDLPPPGRALNGDEVSQLDAVARQIRRAVLCVGYPDHGYGTGFVISAKQRIVVTCAHVAEIGVRQGFLYCRTLESDYKYKVNKVLYHPLFKASLKDAFVITEAGNSPAISALPSLDIAILKLGPEGPDLPAECKLSNIRHGDGLLSRGVGTVCCSASWFGQQEPQAEIHFGTINRFSQFYINKLDHYIRWLLFDASVQVREGGSGSPIFLPNGEVVGISTWSWSHNDTVTALDAAIVREILHHNGIFLDD